MVQIMNLLPLANLAKKHLLLVVALVAMAVMLFHSHQKDKRIQELQNSIALKDKTIEENKGLFEKLAESSANVKGELDNKDVQIQELESQLKKNGEQLSDATSTSLSWKKAYEGVVESTESNVGARKRVDFKHDFGFIGVNGYTLTDPPEAFVSVMNLRPLKLTVATTQDKTGAWHSYVTSSEENISADITVSAVNPNIREEHWYEKIGIVGTTAAGSAFILGLGFTYDLGRVEVGPQFGFSAGDRIDKFFGITALWHPFKVIK